LDPADELASLCKYIELVRLRQYKYALMELDRYLSSYPADAYKVTLEELLCGIQKGFAVNYKSMIMKHCKKNKVTISISDAQ
jgi:hypothetical protein